MVDNRKSFVVLPLGGMKLLLAKAGTTNLKSSSSTFLLPSGLYFMSLKPNLMNRSTQHRGIQNRNFN